MTFQAKKKATAEILARYRAQVAELERELGNSFTALSQSIRKRKLEEMRKRLIPHD